jgi:hypothetical protein
MVINIRRTLAEIVSISSLGVILHRDISRGLQRELAALSL